MVSTSPAPKSTEQKNQPQDVFHRLVKSINGRIESVTSSPTLVDQPSPELPASSSDELPESSSSGAALQRVASSTSSQTKLKKRTKIADRLKKLGQDLGSLKFKQNLNDHKKSVLASPRVTLGELQSPNTSTFTSTPSDDRVPHEGHAKLLSIVTEIEEPALAGTSSDSPLASTSSAPVDPSEPTSLAQRIQFLIDSLPFPNTNPNKKIPVPKNPKPPAKGPDGHPIPPPDSSPIKDSKLLGFLSSPTVMNGSTLKGKPSIWSILDGFNPPPHGFPPAEGESSIPRRSEDQAPNGEDSGDRDTIFSDNSSVMIYSPLIPTNEDLVELAELVPVSVEETPITETPSPITGTSWTSMWPLSLWYGEAPSGDKTPTMAVRRLSGETVISPRRISIDNAGHVVRNKTVRAWVPSNTKLSLQAMWWGYRLYLPPPVLSILSDKTLEATKRASMITSALTWFFNNLPVNTLPAAVRPAAILLQRLVPYLGYIGTFISWSWSTIRNYDIGYGVILTATWLLPIALIPGTWHENDFPTSPTQSPPAPLPLTSPPSDTLSLPPTSPPTSPAPTFPSLPITPPSNPSALSNFTASPSSQSTALSPAASPIIATSYYARIVVDIPVPPTPPELAPIPPTPMPEAVPLGSPLMAQLLNGPVMSTVPLPDEDAPAPYVMKTKKDGRSRAKALFARSSKSR